MTEKVSTAPGARDSQARKAVLVLHHTRLEKAHGVWSPGA